jgi:GTP-binding protein
VLTKRTDLRNIAIIAHVDHGKTTLVDGLLRQSRAFRVNQQVAERVMDSSDLERERGITILAKNTSIHMWDPVDQHEVKINIVDTPGHADFGGEVERVMNMVDGVLLLVDAAEGPMPQTRFVLKKALEMGHRAIVVINKVDRKFADPAGTLNQTFDLFVELGASDEQADFPVVYTNAVTQQAGLTPELGPDLQPLFDMILRRMPPPTVDADSPFQMLVANLSYDTYRGVTAVGRIFAGKVAAGQPVARITRDGQVLPEQARYLSIHTGLELVDVPSASAGEIISVAGLEGIAIGETLADPQDPRALPVIHVEEPTVRMTFGVNTSPFSGREGRWSTSRKLRDRLFDEIRRDVALRAQETGSADTFTVSGRGELHLAILIETMRREGYEFQVSRPEVIFRQGAKGETLEPYEEVYIETPSDVVGIVVEMLGTRRGKMLDMLELPDGTVRQTYLAPTRGLLGFRHHFLTATRGLGTVNALFRDYEPLAGAIASRATGSLVAWEPGVTKNYALRSAEIRGTLFLGPGIEVYEGMVVGERPCAGDLAVNVCKAKHLTNMRQSVKELLERLNPHREMSLDEAIEYLADDELLEVTPVTYRIRKRVLSTHERGKINKVAKKDLPA